MTKEEINQNRNILKRCPCCNANIEDRTISLYKGLIDALYFIYKWCGERSIHEFEMKEIKHMLGKNEYARFGDLVRFGGIIYRPEQKEEHSKALYGINMERASQFFRGERTIPVQITINQITNEIISQVDCHYSQFPSLGALLTKYGLYDHKRTLF